MKCKLLIASIMAATVAISTHATERTFSISPKLERGNHFPSFSVSFLNGVTVYPDVIYQQLEGYTPQIVDIYVPKNEGPNPLVMFIHGGAWLGGDTRHNGTFQNFPEVLATLAAEGFTVVSLEYRLSSEAKFPAQLDDAMAALQFLNENSESYNIDTKKVAIWGASAGAHIAALTAVTCNDKDSVMPTIQICPSAAVSWYGVFDFSDFKTTVNSPVGRLLGCDESCPAGSIKSVSPNFHIDANDPPFLLIHGTEDKSVPISQSQAAEVLLSQNNISVDTLYIEGVGHSFISESPEKTKAASLKAINATFDFFHDKLKGH